MALVLTACSKAVPPPAVPQAATPVTQAASTPAAAPSVAPVQSAAATANVLTAQGIGALRFGMTLAQAEQAAAAKAELPQPFDPECSMVRFASLPKLRFMVEKNIVTRADAKAGVANDLQVDIGDSPDRLKASHPALQVEAGKYEADSHVLTVPGADGRGAIILEEKGGKIVKIRAGLQPAVAYVETCG